MTAKTAPRPETAPQFLRPNFDRMPDELQRRPNWVLWVPIWNGSKWTKRPIQPSGFGASTKNPKHWSSFENVRQAYELAAERGYIELHEKDKPLRPVPIGGVGFVFDNLADEDGLVLAGIDFDRAVFPKTGITSFARERVKRIGSYCEASVSGTGLHVIVKAHPLPSGIAHNGVELYTGGRFFTMTGRAGSNPLPVIAAPDAFAALAEELRRWGAQPEATAVHDRPPQPAKLDLNDFESAAHYVAALNPSPLREYHGWRDFMFACAHAEITVPDQAERVRKLFAQVSATAGGQTESNGELYEGALRATEDRLTRGLTVITGQTITSKARTHGWGASTGAEKSSAETVYYMPGNEAACRDALDRALAEDERVFTPEGSAFLSILRVPDQDMFPYTECGGDLPPIRWDGDLPGTTLATVPDIMERAERLNWMKRGKQVTVRIHPPQNFVANYLQQMRGRYAARVLRGIARVPRIDDDGQIHFPSGYDAATGLYHDKTPSFDVSASPSADSVAKSIKVLRLPFSEYQFENQTAGEALLLGAIFTAIERPYLPTAPMLIIRSSMAGTGKGLLVRCLTQLAYGTFPVFATWGAAPEETEKRIASLLLQSPGVICIDNANGKMIQGDLLESIITEGRADIRILGRSEMVRVHNRSLLLLTGNNPQITGDMARRTLVLDIKPRSADPERDCYKIKPVDLIRRRRTDFLRAAFTIMRAYRLAGMPSEGLPAVGSFDLWSRRVRDLVHWLTGYDLADAFKQNKAEDPHRQDDATLLAALDGIYGAAPFRSGDVFTVYTEVANGKRTAPQQGGLDPKKETLHAALDAVLGSRGGVSAKLFGYWARKVKGAHIGGFQLDVRHDASTNANAITVRRA